MKTRVYDSYVLESYKKKCAEEVFQIKNKAGNVTKTKKATQRDPVFSLDVQETADILECPRHYVFLMDDVLKPQLIKRGQKQTSRFYRPEQVQLVKTEMLNQKVTIVRTFDNYCLCGCNQKTQHNQKYIPLHNETKKAPQASGNLKLTAREQLKKYGLSPEQIASIFASQDNKCGCCRSENSGSEIGWCVDHDHDTKTVRGIICNRCNQFIARSYDPVTGQSDNLPALETAYKNTRSYLIKAVTSTHYIPDAKAVLRATTLLENDRIRCMNTLRNKEQQQKIKQQERDQKLKLKEQKDKEDYAFVRRALGPVVLYQHDLCEKRKQHAAKKTRDIGLMADRISKQRLGIDWLAEKEWAVKEGRAQGKTWLELSILLSVPGSTLATRFRQYKKALK